MNKDNINKLIKLTEKKVDLLKEAKESMIYETCTYHVVQPEKRQYFMLYEIATQKLVRDGDSSYIRKWLERRNIPVDKIYNYQLIEYFTPVKVEYSGHLKINGRNVKTIEDIFKERGYDLGGKPI